RGGLVERGEQLEIALAPEGIEQLDPGPAPLGVEGSQEAGAARALGRVELGHVAGQAFAEYVQIAHDTELVTEPLELGPEAVGPRRLEHGSSLAEKGAEPAHGHPHLVKRLRILAEARAGIVGGDQSELRRDHRAEMLGRWRRRVEFDRRGRWLDAQGAEELRPAVSVGGAGRSQRLLEVAECGLVAARQLGFALAESADRALAAQPLDGVDNALGDGPAAVANAHALAPRAQRGGLAELRPAAERGDEVDEARGRGLRRGRAAAA